jgi:hypothetical protein
MAIASNHNMEDVTFQGVDGVPIPATVVVPNSRVNGWVVMVHGITENRHEVSGFYGHLAFRLANAGFSSFRFDLRGHGDSGMRFEDLTLANGVSDIVAAVEEVKRNNRNHDIHLLGTSFGGGLSALYASSYHHTLRTLVLLCPNLDYRQNWIEEDDYWVEGRLSNLAVHSLNTEGSLPHGRFRIGREMFHELLHIRPYKQMSAIDCPTLVIHGTADSIVPPNRSIEFARSKANSELLLIKGADHGFAVPGDDEFTDPATVANQDRVFTTVGNWLANHSRGFDK